MEIRIPFLDIYKSDDSYYKQPCLRGEEENPPGTLFIWANRPCVERLSKLFY
jgi:hypothetical protein